MSIYDDAKQIVNVIQQSDNIDLIKKFTIPHRCPKCYESVTLIQPQYKGGAFCACKRGISFEYGVR